MLRSLVLVLILANAAFYAWSHGWLDQLTGAQADAQREPQRLKQQVNADRLIVVGAPARASGAEAAEPAGSAPHQGAAAQASSTPVTAASSPVSDQASAGRTICVEAGPFSAAEQAQVEALLQPVLPARNWSTDKVAVQGSWLVYMGPYADAEVLARKLTELHRIKGLSVEEVHSPANLAPGLSLGRYSAIDEANAALSTLKLRGVRTAHIVTLRAPTEVQVVRVAQADIRAQVALSAVKLPQGKSFAACKL